MNRFYRDGVAILSTHKAKIPYVLAGVAVLATYVVSRLTRPEVRVYHSEKEASFKEGRILGGNESSIYEGKERLFSKAMRDLVAQQTVMKETTDRLSAKLDALEKKEAQGGTSVGLTPSGGIQQPDGSLQGVTGNSQALPPASPQGGQPSSSESVHLGAPADHFEISRPRVERQSIFGGASLRREGGGSRREGTQGASVITFPVKETVGQKADGIVLPSGSYVKAKLMTGVEAPEGKTYPVLLQLDYAYIIPNKKRLDLSGCFMIAKAEGALSTERVEMQASKLSCVSKSGRMFERDVNGFSADGKDNSFGVIGSVNSKQDRVAAMAFLTSIVEGVGKALGQAQMTQTTTPLGGTQSSITGDQAVSMAAGGASNAAGLVTQWYLKQAQNLLPTINVGSGQDVWLVMAESVHLPNDYFRDMKGVSNEGPFLYLSRLSE